MATAFAAVGIFILYALLISVQCLGHGINGVGLKFSSTKVSVSGTTISVDRIFCLSQKGTPCHTKILQCPSQCPQAKPADPKAKACFADCSPKCETRCKNRVRGCNGYGSVCYDPRFIGGDGVMFYFHGEKGRDYCLVTDPNLHINAHLIGTRPRGRPRDYTWVQALGVIFASHALTVSADKASLWSDDVDHLSFAFDGRPVVLAGSHLAVWDSPDGAVRIERTSLANSAVVYLAGSAEISVRAVPITEEDNRVHNYQIPADDVFVHLDMQFKFFNLSADVEGVLGHTYRPGFVSPVKMRVPMPVMGGEDRYRTSHLLSSNCKSCQGSLKGAPRGIIAGRHDDVVKSVSECSGRFGSGGGIVCKK